MSTPNRAARGRKRRANANGMGVTTMAIVNGRRKSGAKKRSAAFEKRYAKARAFMKRSKKRARRNGPASDLNSLFDAQMAAAREAKQPAKKSAKKKARKGGAKKKLTPKQLQELRLKNLAKGRAALARKRGGKKTSAQKAGKKPSHTKASAKRTRKASPKKGSKTMAKKKGAKRAKRGAKKTTTKKSGLYVSVRPARRRRKKKAAVAVAATPNKRGAAKRGGKRGAKKGKRGAAKRRRAKRSYYMTIARKNKRGAAKKGHKKGHKKSKKGAASKFPHFYMKMPKKGHRASHKFRVNPMYHANKRRAHRNGIGASLVSNMKLVLSRGIPVTGGFVVQRVVSHFLAEKGLASIGVFQSGAAGEHRKLIAQAIVAPVAVLAAAKFAPKYATDVAIGAGVSLISALLGTVLAKLNQPQMLTALSAYPDAQGVAFHTLGSYEYTPTAGFGDYYEQYSGHPMLEQAAAGFGASGIQQAAAGYPMLQQAAAGTGEYVAQSVSGFGDYEMLNGMGSSQAIDDGIHPDHAEQALTVAEASAGFGDFPLESTVYPGQVPAPIEDAPQGSRAGTFSGREGIFG